MRDCPNLNFLFVFISKYVSSSPKSLKCFYMSLWSICSHNLRNLHLKFFCNVFNLIAGNILAKSKNVSNPDIFISQIAPFTIYMLFKLSDCCRTSARRKLSNFAPLNVINLIYEPFLYLSNTASRNLSMQSNPVNVATSNIWLSINSVASQVLTT